ncbi:hypothetical protein MYX76_16985 [Desulfobacterota bacterium AH_259_B03_O07]|nr:hypothetical protein [Desulfobacterota bacterium AH_259_B03_O07]
MRESSKLLLAGLIAFLVILTIPKPAYSGIMGTFTFRKVADTNTPIPGGTGTFLFFLHVPSLDGGNVAFRGFGTSDQQGIYTDIGGLSVVADKSTMIPGGTGTFTGFSEPSLDGGNVAFKGFGTSDQQGFYTDIGGLGVVANQSTMIPGGTGTFTGFGLLPSLDGHNVAFVGFGTSNQIGIYTDIGGLGVVANQSTMIPGGTGTFMDFFLPSLDGGNVAFQGSGGNSIYKDIGGLSVVADSSTMIPGGTGTFLGFGTVSLDGGNVAFDGSGSFQQGIYTDIGGLGVVADKSTMVPGGTGPFTGFAGSSLDGGNVAFVGSGASPSQGVYINIGGSLIKVIDIGDSLDGKALSSFLIGRECLSGTSIAFRAIFTDFSEGIFVAEIPGDANADGFVNLADLGVIINAFRGTPAPGNGDCNGDTFTNLADLGCVITKFRAQ